MKNISTERRGEISILSGAVLWSLFPILTLLSYTGMGPISALAWTTLISAFFFLGIAIIKRSWTNLLRKEVLIPIFMIVLFNGLLYYVLFFLGLKHTSAGNASIIATLEILFTFLFFNVWQKERFATSHIIGALLMLASAVVILSPNFTSFQPGDFIIMAGVAVAPIGNFFQKKVRALVSSEQILMSRTLIAAPLLFLLAFLLGETVILPTGKAWVPLLINGLVLLGFTKILWLEGIFRISVTKAISLSSIGPIFTLAFAYFILKDLPTTAQLIAIPFAVIGVYLLTKTLEQPTQPPADNPHSIQ